MGNNNLRQNYGVVQTMKLTGKVAVITGGNSGIGFGVARKFAAEGATGLIIGRNESTLEQASRDLGGAFLPSRCDVTQLGSLNSVFRKAHDNFGPIDVLVVAAGGAVGPGTVQPFAEVDEVSFDAMTELNLKSTFFTVQKALPYLADGASVILVSSIAAHKAFPGMSVYSASKAGVRTLARKWSNSVARIAGTRVNPISLGNEILGPAFSDHTKTAISRADSIVQGMTLLLASPDFQRR